MREYMNEAAHAKNCREQELVFAVKTNAHASLARHEDERLGNSSAARSAAERFLYRTPAARSGGVTVPTASSHTNHYALLAVPAIYSEYDGRQCSSSSQHIIDQQRLYR